VNIQFGKEVREGLEAPKKYLSSKWFYNQEGDALYNKITTLHEYYLTRCEREILQTYSSQIAQEILSNNKPIEIIELGGGDGSKAIQLLQSFKGEIDKVIYKPVDISGSALRHLSKKVSEVFPQLKIVPLEADFFAQNWIEANSNDTTRLFLFLGSTIGNFNEGVWQDLLANITAQMQPSDYLLIGFDLVKDPMVIEAAYADSQGVTKAFNLNLLKRINQELGGDFDLEDFEHHSFYNPQLQRAESYLLSNQEQVVEIKQLDLKVPFYAWEAIHTEISRKFTPFEVKQSAVLNNCSVIKSFSDSQGWFMDSLWIKG
jgi:dimethylhistidine N-methyltransferase